MKKKSNEVVSKVEKRSTQTHCLIDDNLSLTNLIPIVFPLKTFIQTRLSDLLFSISVKIKIKKSDIEKVKLN